MRGTVLILLLATHLNFELFSQVPIGKITDTFTRSYSVVTEGKRNFVDDMENYLEAKDRIEDILRGGLEKISMQGFQKEKRTSGEDVLVQEIELPEVNSKLKVVRGADKVLREEHLFISQLKTTLTRFYGTDGRLRMTELKMDPKNRVARWYYQTNSAVMRKSGGSQKPNSAELLIFDPDKAQNTKETAVYSSDDELIAYQFSRLYGTGTSLTGYYGPGKETLNILTFIQSEKEGNLTEFYASGEIKQIRLIESGWKINRSIRINGDGSYSVDDYSDAPKSTLLGRTIYDAAGKKTALIQKASTGNALLRYSINNEGAAYSPRIIPNPSDLPLILDVRIPKIVKIETDVPGINIGINGKAAGTAPGYFLQQDGALNNIVAYGRGYQTKKASISGDDPNPIATFSMGSYDIYPRNLKIVTAPSLGADVIVRGKKLGTTPYTISYEGNESFEITIQKNGLALKSAVADSRPGNTTLDLSFDAEERNLHVSSSPSGASVTVNGKNLGTTPLKEKIYGRPARVAVTMEGRESFLENADSEPQATIEIHASLPFDWSSWWQKIALENEKKRNTFSRIGLELGGSFAMLREPQLAGTAKSAGGGNFGVWGYPNTAGLAWSFGIDPLFAVLGPSGFAFSQFHTSAEIGAAFWLGASVSPYVMAGGGLGFRSLSGIEEKIHFIADIRASVGMRIALNENRFIWGEYEIVPSFSPADEWNSSVKVGICWGVGRE